MTLRRRRMAPIVPYTVLPLLRAYGLSLLLVLAAVAVAVLLLLLRLAVVLLVVLLVVLVRPKWVTTGDRF